MAKSLQEIRDMASIGGRHTWRLRSLSEEEELSAKHQMQEGSDAFEKAFARLTEGDREAAVSALRSAIKRAEKAIETIDK